MKRPVISKTDYLRIKKSLSNGQMNHTVSEQEAEKLLKELDSAKIVEPEQMPPQVVTMNSIVKLTYLKTSNQVSFQLVYPNQANLKEKKISIFSQLAIAIIGYQAGDTIEWMLPGGLTRIRIDEIIYQPEAAGDYNL